MITKAKMNGKQVKNLFLIILHNLLKPFMSLGYKFSQIIYHARTAVYYHFMSRSDISNYHKYLDMIW